MSGTDQSGVSGSSSDKSGTQIAVQKTAQQATATFRTIGGGGQSPQVRVVMPPGATLMPQAMIKQIESNATVRTQITAIPARTISQTSITVTRPVTPTTYFPRAGATATNIQTQRLATPIRTPTPPTVSALSGNFVRGATVARNSSSPATTVISPTTATWMAGGTGVQLIKAINHQSRQRIVAQNITPASTGSSGVVTVGQANIASGQSPQQQAQSNIQTVTSQQTQQQTYVATLATVLPPRQQTATLVYSNVSNTQAQQFNPTGGAPQRFTVAASLAGAPRQMRPLQIGRQFSATKLGVAGMNTTSISIRSPNIPVLAPTLNTGSTTATLQARSTTGSVNLSTTSLSTTRIIQLQQQQPGTGAQQIMGSTGRIASNLMLQPIIMNTTAGGKIGIRPPTTIAAKVQPSLTITQLGLGKLSTAQQQSSNASTLTATNIQGATITPTSTISPAVTGAIVQQQQQQQSQQSSVGQQQTVSVNTQQPITQIVSVNPNMGSGATGQIITAQNVNVSASATVVPLAITSRATNVLTGTITPIKSTAISVPPIAKVLPQQQQQTQQQVVQHQSQNTQIQSNQPTSQPQQTTGLFIHTRPPTSGNTSATAAVIPTSGTFLPAGGTFYYESVPTSVPLSTGVLSLTTTTVTSSVSNSQTVTSTNLATGIVSSIPYTPSQGTFTVVPSTARAIGQIQIPVSTSTGPIPSISQIQAVPLRFNTQHACISEQPVSITGQASIAPQSQQQQSQQATQQHQIITMTQTQQSQQATGQQVQQTHMLIPVQASIKLPVTAMTAASPPRPTGITSIGTVNTAFLRKRESDGSPIRAAKNLAPTLMSMASNTNQQITCAAVLERSKERERERDRDVRPSTPRSRPGSSGGSTTVSANSSPGVDEQMSEEINSMQPMNVRVSTESHFNPINDMYPNHQNVVAPSTVRSTQQNQLQSHQQVATSNGNVEPIPRKKPRRSTNDSVQHPIIQLPSQPISNLQPQQINMIAVNAIAPAPSVQLPNNHEIQPKVNNNNTIPNSNKENAKPAEIIIKKPRTFTLLDGYKLNWKANNHFQRYSDVKPREERRPTVMDLANQSHVVQKINGWKIHHLNSQMEDLCEIETQEYDKLEMMLKQLEKHENNADIDRVSDLIKGNMQRSKIVVDGVNEARTQIMKIFDHKSHVSDIIHRCASKRNFKKREKT